MGKCNCCCNETAQVIESTPDRVPSPFAVAMSSSEHKTHSRSPSAKHSPVLSPERDLQRPARRPSQPGTSKHEESLINALEAEEERLVNTLTRKLEKVMPCLLGNGAAKDRS
jgi:hypothetical protein